MTHITIPDQSIDVAYTVSTATTGPFAFNFSVFSDDDIEVYVDGVLQTKTTHYTVALTPGLESGYPGGSVTFTSARSNCEVYIVRAVPYTRTSDYPNSGPLHIPTVNTDFDRFAAMAQQLDRRLERTIRIPEFDAMATLNPLPPAAERVGKLLGFDQNGNPVTTGGTQTIVIESVTFDNTSEVGFATIGADQKWLKTAGYSAAGDGGGGLYKRVDADPTYGGIRSADRFLSDGSTDNTNGGWWVLVDFFPTPLQFGADRTNTNDSSSAFAEWAPFVAINGLCGTIPAGTYKVDSLTEYNITSRTHFAILGAGSEVTRVQCSADNADGWLSITTSGGNTAFTACTVGGFWVEPLRTTGTTVGFAFKPAGTGTSQHRSIIMRDVYAGTDRSQLGYFQTCIDLTGCRRPYLENVRAVGITGPGTSDIVKTVEAFDNTTDQITITNHGFLQDDQITYATGGGVAPTGLSTGLKYCIYVDANTFQVKNTLAGSAVDFSDDGSGSAHTFTLDDHSDSADRYKCGTGIKVDYCYFPELHNCVGISCQVAFSLDGEGQESALITNPIITACRKGIFWDRRGNLQPLLWIKGGQINYRDVGIEIDGVLAYHIDTVSFRHNPPSQRAIDGGPKDIQIRNARLTAGHIHSCMHEISGDSRRIAYDLGNTGEEVRSLTISEPQFDARWQAYIRVNDANTRNIVVINPRFAATNTAPTSGKVIDGISTNNRAVQWISFGESQSEEAAFVVESFNDSNATGPLVKFKRSSPSPADSDILTTAQFIGLNDATPAEEVVYADIRAAARDVSDATEDGQLLLRVMTAGALATRISMRHDGIAFNAGAHALSPSVTGSRGGNAALASLLTTLASMGLITDGTSA